MTGKKIRLITPSLVLGEVVHSVLEDLALIEARKRFNNSLILKFHSAWEQVSGVRGGFRDNEEEDKFRNRGEKIIQKVIENPGPLIKKALGKSIKNRFPTLPPNFLFSEKHNIFLCGKLDWVEYIEENDSIRIIDFKTGLSDEKPNSLQLPIYSLLIENIQKRPVSELCYWYLERDNMPTQAIMPDRNYAIETLLDISLQIRKLHITGSYICKKGGCFACAPYETILNGGGIKVGTTDRHDLFVLKPAN